jgi:Tol biopolymer transport system component
MSPDGRLFVFPALDQEGNSQLWLRPLDSLTARPLPGTDDGYEPFWSPDSRWIAFFSGSKLKKIAVDGGAPVDICETSQARGGSWGPDGTIIFVPGFATPIYSVPATGGTPAPATQLDKSLQEITHRWPAFLPDGRHFLFFSRGPQSAIYATALGSAQRRLILNNDSNAIYVAPGYLLFVHNGVLMAQKFEADQLELSGAAQLVADNVANNALIQHGLFSASNNGIISIQPRAAALVQPVWVDRSGKVLEVLAEPAMYTNAVISPDGQKAAVVMIDPQNGSWNTWILDLKGHQKSRITSEPSVGYSPVWSPDGNEILFTTSRLGAPKIFRIPSTGVGQPTPFLPSDDADFSAAWSPDGRYIVFIRNPVGEPNQGSLWIAPTFGDKKPYRLIEAIGSVGEPDISPDGKWLAYDSKETGRWEVYVVPFPEANRKIPVSSGSGTKPKWARDGKELYYLRDDGTLEVVAIHAGKDGLHVGNTQTLFKLNDIVFDFDVSPDGKLLVFKDAGDQPTSAITLITNWPKALQK